MVIISKFSFDTGSELVVIYSEFLLFYMQSQLTEFRSFEGQDMYTGEKIVPIKVFIFSFRSFEGL